MNVEQLDIDTLRLAGGRIVRFQFPIRDFKVQDNQVILKFYDPTSGLDRLVGINSTSGVVDFLVQTKPGANLTIDDDQFAISVSAGVSTRFDCQITSIVQFQDSFLVTLDSNQVSDGGSNVYLVNPDGTIAWRAQRINDAPLGGRYDPADVDNGRIRVQNGMFGAVLDPRDGKIVESYPYKM